MTTFDATYSPEDNKLRLYPSSRLSPELYARVKAAGFAWAPKQELFVAPMWTPERADLCEELAGEIGDEDKSLTERAEERAERFEDYSENRRQDYQRERAAVAAIADNIPWGEPILVGHHSERHARRDAERIENGMRRAVKAWETADYWQRRAAGAVRAAKYKERPDVRARRIKGLESELRKLDRADKESADTLKRWAYVDKPEAWKANAAGEFPTREQRAFVIAGAGHYPVQRDANGARYWTAYDVLRPEGERYQDAPRMTVDEVMSAIQAFEAGAAERRARWRAHYEHRLTYERAMLAAEGGTVADKAPAEKGGAVRCWCSPGYGKGWSYVQKVNKVSVTVLDNWGNGGKSFTRTIPFDKLVQTMTAAQVNEARAAGLLAECENGTGFFLRDKPDGTPAETRDESRERAHREAVEAAEQRKQDDEAARAMRETLRAGVQVVSAPQLFPTPPDLAARMVELAEIPRGARVLEPSAGTGAILDALPPGLHVVACEINNALCRRINTHPIVSTTIEGDFLDMAGADPKFDRILMNPPFGDAADIKHIEHARSLLKPGGRIVAICANGPRQRERLMPLCDSWEELPRDTFAGTSVSAALIVING